MKTLVVDGNNAAHRLGATLPELTANGKPVQVVYGFLKLIRSAIVQFEPDVSVVCWDNGRSAYRKKLYPDYKANRKHDSNSEKEKSTKASYDRLRF